MNKKLKLYKIKLKKWKNKINKYLISQIKNELISKKILKN